MQIPKKGLSREDVLTQLDAYGSDDVDWRAGQTFAYIYDGGPEIEEIGKRAYMRYLTENALDPTVYPSLLRFEQEVIAMAARHLGGDAEVVGNFTSGGTESCMLAVKTARDRMRAHKPEITRPEIILPVTAHAAFHKAAHYFCVEPVLVEVDPVSYCADPEKVRAAITPNTIQIVASAVSYAHGVMDPIPELGALALEHDVLLHVDGCIGAFVLPYFRRLGAEFCDFDFSVPGVTSMSMDLHKYAYCPKGASVVLHKNRELRRHQIFTCSDWTGYTIINPTMLSTKSGGPLAAAWAVLNFVGDEGYMAIAKRTFEATKKVRAWIEARPELELLGDPDMCLLAFASEQLSVFHVIDEMKARGWYVQPQLGFRGSKSNVHLSIDQSSLDKLDGPDGLLAALDASVDAAKALSAADDPKAIAQIVQFITAAAAQSGGVIDKGSFAQMTAMVGFVDGKIPERLAPLNQILEGLPAEVTKFALTEFFNDLYIQRV